MIIFENIDTGETVGIDRNIGGKHYRAKLSAIMNSSNMSPNADRGQDFGWRLAPEQQALIEDWENDPDMIDRVSRWSKVMLEDLTHSEFLAYLLYQEELGLSPERSTDKARRDKQRDYESRVAAIKAGKPEAMPAFDPKIARGEATIDDFLSGDLTGDAGGDKVEEKTEDVAEPAPVEPVTVGVDTAKKGDDKSIETPAPKPSKAKK